MPVEVGEVYIQVRAGIFPGVCDALIITKDFFRLTFGK